MKTYITEIEVNWKTYAWNEIQADTWEEAESKCLKWFEVVWEKIKEFNF